MTDKLKGKILIVDDQESMRKSTAFILEMEGYEVFTLENGYKAIEKVKEISFDVAFLDIKMPGINGVETFREIKKISPETTVVMMTAYAMEDLIKEALNEGAYACVYKPFEMEKILEIVQNIKKKPMILIVEDDLNNLNFLDTILTEKGYKVVSVDNGREAIKLARRKPVNVVLLDIVMPEMDGLETLKKIKEITGEDSPEVIMMSAYEVGDKVKQAMKIGANKFLCKPIDINTLESSIKQLLQEKNITEKPSILIVDDDVSLAKMISAVLIDEGYEVKIANTGFNAIEQIKSDMYKIIFLDVKLPDINGIELYNEIKKNKPDTGVIMMTAYSKDEAIIEAIKKGDYICLYKPFELEEMINIVDKICGRGKNK